MSAAYVITNSSDGQFLFNLQAANGEVILTSERYVSRGGVTTGIASVKTNSSNSGQYTRRFSRASEPYFVLTAQNGEVIGTSEMYSSTQARDVGIDSVTTNGPLAETVDRT